MHVVHEAPSHFQPFPCCLLEILVALPSQAATAAWAVPTSPVNVCDVLSLCVLSCWLNHCILSCKFNTLCLVCYQHSCSSIYSSWWSYIILIIHISTQADNIEGVALYADDMVTLTNFVTWNKNNMEQLCHKAQRYHWTILLQGTNTKHWTTLLQGTNITLNNSVTRLCYMVQT